MMNIIIILITIVYILIALALLGFCLFCMWKVFEKAGKPGWAGIIPIYNLIIYMEIAKRPLWWAALCFIPFVGQVFYIIGSVDFAKQFGKSTEFGIGLGMVSIVFLPMIAFSENKFVNQLEGYWNKLMAKQI